MNKRIITILFIAVSIIFYLSIISCKAPVIQIEEESVEQAKEEAEEEVIQTEPKEESTSEQKTKTIKETTDETIEANPIETEETSSKKNTPDITFPIRVKTLVLNYDPIIPSQDNKKLHQVCGWNDPKELVQSYINDIYQCSGGKVIYEVVDWIDINDVIPFVDGFKYSPEGYIDCFNKACSERWDYWAWE